MKLSKDLERALKLYSEKYASVLANDEPSHTAAAMGRSVVFKDALDQDYSGDRARALAECVEVQYFLAEGYSPGRIIYEVYMSRSNPSNPISWDRLFKREKEAYDSAGWTIKALEEVKRENRRT